MTQLLQQMKNKTVRNPARQRRKIESIADSKTIIQQ